jgi:hypothetical protein
MTTFDRLLEQLANQLNTLSKRSQVAFYWACASALQPEFRAWAAHRGASETLLNQSLSIAADFASTGAAPERFALGRLLEALEASTPPGESPDEFPATNAQDCWICADVCIRVLVDGAYSPGSAIWYALEPVVTEASVRCFGVSQVGSGESEEAYMQVIQRQPVVVAALDYCRWAINFLGQKPSPDADDIALVRMRADALRP